MKKLFLSALTLLIICQSFGQAINDTTALRAAIIADVVPNSNITALKLNRILQGNINALSKVGITGLTIHLGTDSIFYVKAGVETFAFLLPPTSLQAATDDGNRTDTNILVKSAYTNNLFADSTHEADYEFVVIPDIQGMTHWQPEVLYTISNWIRDNKTANNIKAVLQLGDLCDNSETYEWARADTMFKTIDSANVPYIAAAGNHDYDGGNYTGDRLTTEYNTYFGADRYAGKPWYGGNYQNKNENSYIKFDVGTTKYIVISLEFMAHDTALAWAGRVLDTNYDRKAIIITHGYVTIHGELSQDSSLYVYNYGDTANSNSGQEMWDKFVKNYSNIFMVLNGHFVAGWGDYSHVRTTPNVGVNGNVVQQILINYQKKGCSNLTNNPQGIGQNCGDGYFARFRVSPKNGKIYLSFYSSRFNAYDPIQDSFDIEVPNVQINTTLSVKGNALVGEDLKVKGKIFSTIPRYSIPIIGENGQLRDTTDLSLNAHILTVPGLKVKSFTTTGAIPFVGSGDNRMRINTKLYYDSTLSSLTSNTSGLTIPSQFLRYQYTSANSGTSAGVAVISANNTATTKGVLVGQRARGTLDAMLDVANGDELFGIISGGIVTGARQTTAEISFRVDGIPVTGSIPTGISFITGANGARTQKMFLSHLGNLSLGGANADSSAQLHLQSTSRGFLLPRMTTAQMNAIASPATGLQVYDTDLKAPMFYNGYSWGTTGLQTQASRVTTQFDKTNNTLADITGLTANLIAGKKYRFEANLYCYGSTNAGVKFSIGGTATTTSVIFAGMLENTNRSPDVIGVSFGSVVASQTTIVNNLCFVLIKGTVEVNAAGTITVQFAQNVTDAIASTVYANSTFIVTEIQ